EERTLRQDGCPSCAVSWGLAVEAIGARWVPSARARVMPALLARAAPLAESALGEHSHQRAQQNASAKHVTNFGRSGPTGWSCVVGCSQWATVWSPGCGIRTPSRCTLMR